jgi:methanogenic corrinoid protein MtbC1
MEERQTYLERFENALLSLDWLATRDLFSEIAERFKGKDSAAYLEGLIVPVMEKIGAGWEKGDVSLSQVYMSGRICERLLAENAPVTAVSPTNMSKIAIAVLEDYHLLGKRMVKSVLMANGLQPVDYGTKSAPDLAACVIKDGIEILLVSTLMLPSALRVKDLKKILSDSGSDAKIVVGGAPFRFDDNLWKQVGADATGKRASDAIGLINKIMKEKNG